MIEATGITKRYGRFTAVQGLDLEVPDGVVCGLLGPNGAGKTTTIRMVTGMLPPDEGTLRVAGHPMPATGALSIEVAGGSWVPVPVSATGNAWSVCCCLSAIILSTTALHTPGG